MFSVKPVILIDAGREDGHGRAVRLPVSVGVVILGFLSFTENKSDETHLAALMRSTSDVRVIAIADDGEFVLELNAHLVGSGLNATSASTFTQPFKPQKRDGVVCKLLRHSHHTGKMYLTYY